MRLDVQVVYRPAGLVQRLLASRPVLARVMDQAVEDLARQVEGRAKKYAPVDRGHLRASIGVDKAGPLARKVGTGIRSGDPIPYSRAMEYGLPPGYMPPYQPLREWVWRNRRKFGIGGSGKQAERNVSRVAHFVRLKIFRQGIKERRYLRRALEEVFRTSAKRTVRLYADRAIREVLGG